MKSKFALIALVIFLGLLILAGLAFFVLFNRQSLPRTTQLILFGVAFGLLLLLSLLLRTGTSRSERRARQALEELGFEKANWISRQYRGVVDGREYEILPFLTKGFGDVLALHILSRGTFNTRVLLALPRGLSHFAVWEAEPGAEIKLSGYAGLLVYGDDPVAARAFLEQPETERLVKELFTVPTQTPIVLELASGTLRLRVGRLDLLGFDVELLRRWLRILGALGRLAGSTPSVHLVEPEPDPEFAAFRRRSRWWMVVALMFTLVITVTLMAVLLMALK